MTEKVKVTQEQFEWLEKYKTEQQIDYAIDIQLHRKRPDSPIADWKLSEVARALYVGYEVEPKFKVGDWVARKDGEAIIENYIHGTKIHCVQVEEIETDFIVYDKVIRGVNGIGKGVIRHATPEEIKAEKERRIWSAMGREVGEFKRGDILVDDGGRIYQTFEVDAEEIYELGALKGFYPAESFVKFGGDE